MVQKEYINARDVIESEEFAEFIKKRERNQDYQENQYDGFDKKYTAFLESIGKGKKYDKWADVKYWLSILANALVPVITTVVVVYLMFFSDLEPLWGWIAALVVAFGTLMIMIKR